MAELKEQGERSQPQNPEWKHDFSPGPSEEELTRFEGPKMLLSDEDAEKQRLQEQEFRARSEYLGREEQYSRRDPELQLLLFPESAKDINKAVLRILEKYTSLDLREANSPYRLQYYMDAADAGEFIFSHSTKDLHDEGYIDGEIGADGYLNPDGRPKKFGYAIRVDTEKREIRIKEEKETRHERRTERTKQTHYIPRFNSEGKVESLEPIQVEVETEHPDRIEKWEEVSKPTITIEKFYYGTDNRRRELHNASKAAFERLVTTARMHDLFQILESNRADISGLVTILYLKANHISNEQWGQIFNSPDIAKITPENLQNNEYGGRIDKAMRMMDLLGHAETREKMEGFMNKPTFEKIVDAAKPRALEIMRQLKYEDPEARTEEEKVVRFLVGKGAIREDGKWALRGWLSSEERDPANASPEERQWWKDKDERWTRGFNAIEREKGFADENGLIENGVRGFLTEFGNVWARGERGEIEIMLARIKLLLGDGNAIRDADRIFELTGMRDELNLEVLSEKIPTAEEIIAAHRINDERGYEEWRDQAEWWLEYFKLAGDPTASDLSKIFYPHFFRLKDILRDRPAGPLLTVSDFQRFTQSMLSLGRSEVEVSKGRKETRSLLEQWRGYAGGDTDELREEAKDLGEIDWDAVDVPEDISKTMEELKTELKDDEKALKEVLEMMIESKSAIKGGIWAYYCLMNWLAGRDNVLKAPWLFALDEKENIRALNILETYTSKEKFLSIIWHGPAIAWGNWRERYRGHRQTEKPKKLVDALEEEAKKAITKGKKAWYKGVRNLPQFPEFMAQKVKVIRATGAGYSEFEVPMLERVEGRPDEPGLAVNLGFMSIGEVAENKTKRFLREQQLR